MPAEEQLDRFDNADGTGLVRVWPSRKLVNLLDMQPEDFKIDDIAHALARQCRYNGHVDGFISVAEHCVRVSKRIAAEGGSHMEQACGLLHDAAEAYTGDLIGPLKHMPGMEMFAQIEERIERALFAAYELPYPMPLIVKRADKAEGEAERISGTGLRSRTDNSGLSHFAEDKESFLYLAGYFGIRDAH